MPEIAGLRRCSPRPSARPSRSKPRDQRVGAAVSGTFLRARARKGGLAKARVHRDKLARRPRRPPRRASVRGRSGGAGESTTIVREHDDGLPRVDKVPDALAMRDRGGPRPKSSPRNGRGPCLDLWCLMALSARPLSFILKPGALSLRVHKDPGLGLPPLPEQPALNQPPGPQSAGLLLSLPGCPEGAALVLLRVRPSPC